jgi:hypothetical protein
LQVSAGQAVEPQVVDDDLGVTVQLEVPLQVRVLQSSEVQVIGVPWQTLPEQTSPHVQA